MMTAGEAGEANAIRKENPMSACTS
jgi:hypothetical protein